MVLAALALADAARNGLPWAALLGAALLALVHVVAPALRFLHGTPRSVWLSVAGGVSVSYVFMHLLPELAEGQRHLSRALAGGMASELSRRPGVGFAERHVYLIALAGLAIFHGLDKLAEPSRARPEGPSAGGDGSDARRRDPGRDDGVATSPGVFWVHMASFAVYNALIGYLLLHREASGPSNLLLFAVAMSLHFLVTDIGLHEDHQHRYRAIGRWVLVAAVVAGVLVGLTVEVSEAVLAVFIALLAGGVMLNVLKEEVPGERQSRFWAFAGGMAGYAILLLMA